MDERYVFLGEFKGMFFTLQELPLDSTSPFPEEQEHIVRVYQGVLTDAEFQDEYKPEDYRNLETFVLSNVPKIQINPKGPGPFKDIRTYTFSQLLLLHPKVERTFDINGKTYGEIVSKAYGITEKFPLTKFDGETNVTEQNDSDNTFNNNQGGNNYGNNSNKGPVIVDEGYTQNVNQDTDSTTVADPITWQDRWDSVQSGCGYWFSGCLANFWSILFWLILLWFLWSILRSCNDGVDHCELKRIAEQKLNDEKLAFRKTKKDYEQNLKLALNAYSRIYFYRNETQFHLNSLGEDSPIGKIANILSSYKEKQFIIEGFTNGTKSEAKGLDLQRAEKMRDTLVSLGIEPERLFVIGKKDSLLLEKSRKLNNFYISQGNVKQYNRNMRVEIKLNPKNP
jgi:outer membrane protein OmpA-like peptidoglycan-associated protein